MSNTQPGTFKALIEARDAKAKLDAEKPKLEFAEKADQTQTIPDADHTQTTTKSIPKADQTQTRHSKNIAPEKDFNKRANILEREALPNGLFPGASKAIYDALYLRTLGAITPKRTVQATRKELMKWSGIKNIKTINAHLKRLRNLRLVEATNFVGEHTGSHYEVFLPEGHPDQTQTTQTKGRLEANQKMDVDQHQKMVWVGSGNQAENKEVSESLRLFKDNKTNDDEPFSAMIDVLTKISEKVSGKVLQRKDSEKWKELAELLAMELEIASSRTNSITSVPAFLTEHLRRRLIQKLNPSKPKVVKSLPIESKESETPIFEAEPLTLQGREVVIKTFREYIEKGQRDFVMSFKETYTKDDWMFLMKNL